MSSFLYPAPSAYSEDSTHRRTRRPVSAKAAFSGSRRPSRPGSANRMASMSHRTPSNSKLTSQSMLLNRLRPATIDKDKETLFEDNLAVKVQLNELRKENVRLKTRNIQLERELMQVLEASEGKTRLSYMQNSSPLAKFKGLRKKVQALNQELISKEAENDDMRRAILFTRKSELETQVNVYAEECQRLRTRISELAEDRERLIKTEQMYEELQGYVRDMEKQNEDLRKSLGKSHKESQKTKRNSLKDKRKLTSTKLEIANLKAEIVKLRGGDFAGPLSDPKPRIRTETSPVPKSIQVTQAEIKKELGYEYSVPELVLRLGTFAGGKGDQVTGLIARVVGPKREVSAEELFIGLRQEGFYWEREEARMLLEHIHHPGNCPTEELTAFLTKHVHKSPPKSTPSPTKLPTFPRISLSEVQNTLRHIAYRLQLQRFPKSKLMSLLIGTKPDRFRSLQVPQLQLILSKSPFEVGNEEESGKLARFLIETENMGDLTAENIGNMRKSVGDIVEKFSRSMENWEGFSPEEEEGFDQHIGAVLNRNKRTFKAACKGFDHENTEIIAYSAFEEVLISLEFDFSEKEKHYLQLLFYSSLQTLDQVPYKELLKAYTEGGQSGQSGSQDSLEPSEAELRGMVQKYLQLIANALVTKQIPVSQAFAGTDGYVSPQQFYEGYMSLRLPPINQQSLGVIVEALQGEEERPDFSIRLSFLEEVFTHYGVGTLSTPNSQSSGDFGGKDDLLSEKSPFLTEGKRQNPPQTSDLKQWEVSESEEQQYEEEDFESASARSV